MLTVIEAAACVLVAGGVIYVTGCIAGTWRLNKEWRERERHALCEWCQSRPAATGFEVCGRCIGEAYDDVEGWRWRDR